MTPGNAKEWQVSILKQLDRYASDYDFPMIDNAYFDCADIRLTAFCSSVEWLLVFEEIALSNRYSFVSLIHAYGNKVRERGTLQIVKVISGLPDKPIWDDMGYFQLDMWNFEVVINEKVRSFDPSPKDYRRAGIDVESKMPMASKILRLLTFLMAEEFFFSDDRLLEICGRNKAGLKRFLQLEDWHHPDIANDEPPSQSMCFQNLALALAKNDKSLYVCPQKSLNTHWSHWEGRKGIMSHLDRKRDTSNG